MCSEKSTELFPSKLFKPFFGNVNCMQISSLFGSWAECSYNKVTNKLIYPKAISDY
jgi:hypothetical protein